MLSAAEQRANAEMSNRCFELAAKSRQPSRATEAGDDIRLFRHSAEHSKIGNGVQNRSGTSGNGQSKPGAQCQWGKGRLYGPVQVLEEAQEPICRQTCEPVLILRSREC